jgi:hypothetical protein
MLLQEPWAGTAISPAGMREHDEGFGSPGCWARCAASIAAVHAGGIGCLAALRLLLGAHTHVACACVYYWEELWRRAVAMLPRVSEAGVQHVHVSDEADQLVYVLSIIGAHSGPLLLGWGQEGGEKSTQHDKVRRVLRWGVDCSLQSGVVAVGWVSHVMSMGCVHRCWSCIPGSAGWRCGDAGSLVSDTSLSRVGL